MIIIADEDKVAVLQEKLEEEGIKVTEIGEVIEEGIYWRKMVKLCKFSSI